MWISLFHILYSDIPYSDNSIKGSEILKKQQQQQNPPKRH